MFKAYRKVMKWCHMRHCVEVTFELQFHAARPEKNSTPTKFVYDDYILPNQVVRWMDVTLRGRAGDTLNTCSQTRVFS
jgi:hypothetical protein